MEISTIHPSGYSHSQPQNISTLQAKNNKHAIKEHSSWTDIRSFRVCLFAWGFADASSWLAGWWTSFLFGSKPRGIPACRLATRWGLTAICINAIVIWCYLSRSVLSVPNPTVMTPSILIKEKYILPAYYVRVRILKFSQGIHLPKIVYPQAWLSTFSCCCPSPPVWYAPDHHSSCCLVLAWPTFGDVVHLLEGSATRFRYKIERPK